MKRTLTPASAILVLAGLILFAQTQRGRADEAGYRQHHRHHPHLFYAQYVPQPGACRVGWWQSLRYGHARPYWATWCR